MKFFVWLLKSSSRTPLDLTPREAVVVYVERITLILMIMSPMLVIAFTLSALRTREAAPTAVMFAAICALVWGGSGWLIPKALNRLISWSHQTK